MPEIVGRGWSLCQEWRLGTGVKAGAVSRVERGDKSLEWCRRKQCQEWVDGSAGWCRRGVMPGMVGTGGSAKGGGETESRG